MYGTGSYGRGFNTAKLLNIHRSNKLNLHEALLEFLQGHNFCGTQYATVFGLYNRFNTLLLLCIDKLSTCTRDISLLTVVWFLIMNNNKVNAILVSSLRSL